MVGPDPDNFRERFGELNAKTDAAHRRLDDLRATTAADLIEIKTDVKTLLAHMNRQVGFATAAAGAGALVGTLIGVFAPKLFS